MVRAVEFADWSDALPRNVLFFILRVERNLIVLLRHLVELPLYRKEQIKESVEHQQFGRVNKILHFSRLLQLTIDASFKS